MKTFHRGAFNLALACSSLLPIAVAGAATATSTLPPGAVLVEAGGMPIDVARAEADAARVLARIDAGDAGGALALLHAWPDPLRFEPAAARAIELLQMRTMTAAVAEVLAWLERAPVRVYRRHDESAGDWFVPLHDVGSRAASARRLHALAGERDALLLALRRDPLATLATRKSSPTALVAALERLPDADVERIARLVVDGDAPLPSPAWAMLARRAPRPDVLAALLSHADSVDVLPLLSELAPRLAPADALAWLERAATDAAHASAAVAALGTLAPRSKAAEVALLAHLGDPRTGASAALALSRLAVPDRVARIDALLAKAARPEVVADLALALRLEGSDAARVRLQQLEHDLRLPAAAKSELQR